LVSTISKRAKTATLIALSFLLVFFFTFGPAISANAVTDEELASAKAQLEEANAAASEAAENYYAALDAHDAAVSKMEDAKQTIDEVKAQLAEKQEHLSNRAVSMYRNGSPTLLDVLLGSASFKDFANTWNLLTKMNEDDTELIGEIKDLKQQAEDAYNEYAAQEKEASKQLKEAETAKSDMEAKAASYEETYNSLNEEMQAQIQAEKQAQAEASKSAQTQPANDSDDSSSDNGGSSGGGYVRGGGSSVCNVSLALSKVGCPYV
jgi:peptidoglycan hydrolase CwlO-like protein